MSVLDSRWQCPKCGSKAVEVCLPAWFSETQGLDLSYQSADEEAEIIAWCCGDCGESDAGQPTEVEVAS